jgi:cobalt-zinc-cadmium efflux system outer membrane protein
VSARARLARAQRVLELEKARRLPDPTLIAGYKRTGGADTLVTGVIVPLPLFDQNTGNIERATADEQAAAFELDTLRTQQLAAMVVLIQSAQALTEARASIATPPASGNRSPRRALAFREGAANILQLVDAERVCTGPKEKRSNCNSKPTPNP